MKVILRVDDIDRHGIGCECGLCNSNGKAYGCALFDAEDRAKEDPIDRIYGPSEQAVLENAKTLCREKGWEVVVETEA